MNENVNSKLDGEEGGEISVNKHRGAGAKLLKVRWRGGGGLNEQQLQRHELEHSFNT